MREIYLLIITLFLSISPFLGQYYRGGTVIRGPHGGTVVRGGSYYRGPVYRPVPRPVYRPVPVPVHYGFYTPYYYHPFGYTVATIATTAIVVTIINDANDNTKNKNSDGPSEVMYDDGVYYKKEGDKYVVIPPPNGAAVPSIPDGYTVVKSDKKDYYYTGGTFYELNNNQYVVVVAPIGVTVPYIPESGYTKEQIGDKTYILYNGIYFLPKHSGDNVTYEVVKKPT